MLPKHASRGENGHLMISGLDSVELAEKYGTPLYLIDEETVRLNCREYINSMKRYFSPGSFPLYASKALSCAAIYRIMAAEGMGIDCVSYGEIHTALKAGFSMENVFFHGNNKTDADIDMAMDAGVGYFVVDNTEELLAVDSAAGKKETRQKILLRITPGIDPHTHKKIITGNVDSKFGNAIVTGQAMDIVKLALSCSNVVLCGLHCHIGSQIFETEPFADAADIMLKFIADIKNETGYDIKLLNLGGGFGARYTNEDPYPVYSEYIRKLSEQVKRSAESLRIVMPDIILEPGRSIVAEAGITLYTVGSFKEIKGYKSYVSIDGGMPDNPRYALYGSKYSAVIANKVKEEKSVCCSIAGRCCESGDLIAEDIMLQKPERGDILAVMSTGAYNYSMASNYNRIPRPPIVIIKDRTPRIAVKRESFDDIIMNDI